jgi:hypothetical protein
MANDADSRGPVRAPDEMSVVEGQPDLGQIRCTNLTEATGFEPATFRPPAERIQASMCLGASVVSYVSTAVDDLDR